MSIRYGISRWTVGLMASLFLSGQGAGNEKSADDAQYLISQAPAPGVQKSGQPGESKSQTSPNETRRDRADGRQRNYPKIGQQVIKLPGNVAATSKNGVNYWYARGVWYARQGDSYTVVRPPMGISTPTLPRDHTPVMVGNRIYYYANGVYYREKASGGYEVVPAPSRVLGSSGAAGDDPAQRNVVPKYGQSTERQSVDEEECHRWALEQSRLDTTGVLDEKKPEALRRSDYLKAQSNCLLARGYEVR